MADPFADALSALTLLQHGDSQFPSGGFAYSGGLEGLLADGLLHADALPACLRTLLATRWAGFERVVVAQAWAAAESDDLPALAALDATVEAALLAPAERTGSRRAGAALLTTHLRLGTRGAAPLAAAHADGRLAGHRAVLEGALWYGVGLARRDALLLSGQAYAGGLASAALRLGHLGALALPSLVQALRPEIARLALSPLPADGLPRSFNPLAEIAIMRRPVRDRALFAT